MVFGYPDVKLLVFGWAVSQYLGVGAPVPGVGGSRCANMRLSCWSSSVSGSGGGGMWWSGSPQGNGCSSAVVSLCGIQMWGCPHECVSGCGVPCGRCVCLYV